MRFKKLFAHAAWALLSKEVDFNLTQAQIKYLNLRDIQNIIFSWNFPQIYLKTNFSTIGIGYIYRIALCPRVMKKNMIILWDKTLPAA